MWLKTLVRTQYGPYRLRGLRKGQVLEMDPIPPPSFDTREGGGAGGGAGGGGGSVGAMPKATAAATRAGA